MRPPATVFFLLLACIAGSPISAAQPQSSRTSPSFDELIQTIRTGNAYQRAEATAPLSWINDPRVVPELIALLNDEDSRVRSDAAQQLARLGDEQSADPLAAALADSDGYVRSYAAEGLAKIGNRRHIPALVASVMDHLPDPNTSTAEGYYSAPALEAIARLSPKTPSQLIGLLEEISVADRTQDEDRWRLLENVARCLGQIGDKAAFEPLQRAREALEAGHHDYRTWYAVRKALAAIDSEKTPFDRPPADILDSHRVSKIDDEGIRRKWILPLVELGEQAVEDIDWALRFESEWDRGRLFMATKALGEIGGQSAADVLRKYIERQSSLSERDQRARRLLWREMLLALLKADPNEATVQEIILASQQLSDFEQEYLVHDISSVSPERIPQEIKTLSYRRVLLGGTSAKPLSSYAVSRAARLLGQVGGQEAGEILSKALLSSPPDDRGQAAASALGEIKGYDSVPTLITALESANVSKGAIARALGMIADRRAVPPLTDAARRDKLGGQDRLWIAAALARFGEDYPDNARLIREALPSSLEQAKWLHDEESIRAIAALINGEALVVENAVRTLEAIGSDRAFNALISQVDIERIDDPLRLQQITSVAARMGEKLGHSSKEYWTTVATVTKAVRGWFETGQQTAQSARERFSAEPVIRDLPLARRVWIAEVNRRLDLAASGKAESYQCRVPAEAVSNIESFFARELVPTLERIIKESDSTVGCHAKYGVVQHYDVRSKAARILTEKTGQPYTFVDVDGRTHPGGWNPSQDE